MTDCELGHAEKVMAPVNDGPAMSPGLVRPVIPYCTEPEVNPPVNAPVQDTVIVPVATLPSVTVTVGVVTL